MYSAAILLFLALAFSQSDASSDYCISDDGHAVVDQLYQGLTTEHRLIKSWRNKHLGVS